MDSRLSRSIARDQLRNGNALGGDGRYPIDPATGRPARVARQQQVAPQQLIAMMYQAGERAQWRVLGSKETGEVRLEVKFGPFVIPLEMDVPGTGKLVDDLTRTAELVALAPQPAAEEDDLTYSLATTDPELERLLADSQARTGGGHVPAAEACTIVDEAADVPDEAWEAIDSLDSSRVIRLPAHPDGHFDGTRVIRAGGAVGKSYLEVISEAAAEAAPALQAIQEARDVHDAQFLPAESCTDSPDEGYTDDDILLEDGDVIRVQTDRFGASYRDIPAIA